MVKSELLSVLSDRLSKNNIAQRDIRMAISVILNGMVQSVLAGQRIEIRGFGSFDLSHHQLRLCRNPKSGEPVVAPAKYVLHFKAGKALRGFVNERAPSTKASKKSPV